MLHQRETREFQDDCTFGSKEVSNRFKVALLNLPEYVDRGWFGGCKSARGDFQVEESLRQGGLTNPGRDLAAEVCLQAKTVKILSNFELAHLLFRQSHLLDESGALFQHFTMLFHCSEKLVHLSSRMSRLFLLKGVRKGSMTWEFYLHQREFGLHQGEILFDSGLLLLFWRRSKFLGRYIWSISRCRVN